MNRDEFLEVMGERGLAGRVFVNTEHIPSAGLHEVYVIEEDPVGAGWLVSYAERGTVSERARFEQEEDAYRYVHDQLLQPPPAGVTLSEDELAHGREITQRMEDVFRARAEASEAGEGSPDT